MRGFNKQSKLIYGVGVNDVDRPVWTREGGKRVVCQFYSKWIGMLMRCYAPQLHAKRPTYTGCITTEEWLRFSNFELWMGTQDWEGKQLDKDLLVPNNKLYSPETCVFLPRKLNMFLLDSAASRGKYPIGVSWDKGTGRFVARCRNPFTDKEQKLGRFDTPEEAHLAWKERKHEFACIYADQQTDERVAEALRNRYL